MAQVGFLCSISGLWVVFFSSIQCNRQSSLLLSRLIHSPLILMLGVPIAIIIDPSSLEVGGPVGFLKLAHSAQGHGTVTLHRHFSISHTGLEFLEK